MIETYRGAVYPSQLDHMGHMNVQYYTMMFDQATWHLFNELGLTRKYFEDQERGMAAAEIKNQYYEELFSGDIVHIKTHVEEVKNRALVFVHSMINSGTKKEVASARCVAVHIDHSIRKPCQLPDYIKENAGEFLK